MLGLTCCPNNSIIPLGYECVKVDNCLVLFSARHSLQVLIISLFASIVFLLFHICESMVGRQLISSILFFFLDQIPIVRGSSCLGVANASQNFCRELPTKVL